MSGDEPDAPDIDNERDDYERVWVQSLHRGDENVLWYDNQWARQSAELDNMLSTIGPLTQQFSDWATKDRNRYERVFQPVEDDLIRDYQTYNSGDRIALDRSRAIADVNQAYEAERENASRRLESYGIDPSQVRGQAMDRDVRLAQAAATSAAANQARLQTEQTGRDLRTQALEIGQGYPNRALAAAQSASNLAQAGVNATNTTVNSGMQNRNAAIEPWKLSANTVNQWTAQETGNYANQQAEYQSGTTALGGAAAGAKLGSTFGPVGGLVGAGIGGLAGSLFADGGPVEGPGGPKGDAIPARLSDGEYVIPEEVVRWKGEEFFAKTIDKAREAQGIPPPPEKPAATTPQASGPPVQHLADGGPVLPSSAFAGLYNPDRPELTFATPTTARQQAADRFRHAVNTAPPSVRGQYWGMSGEDYTQGLPDLPRGTKFGTVPAGMGAMFPAGTQEAPPLRGIPGWEGDPSIFEKAHFPEISRDGFGRPVYGLQEERPYLPSGRKTGPEGMSLEELAAAASTGEN